MLLYDLTILFISDLNNERKSIKEELETAKKDCNEFLATINSKDSKIEVSKTI